MKRIQIKSSEEKTLIYGAFGIALFFAIVDVLSKNAIVNHFRLGESEVVIQGYFNLCYILNYGAAFGSMQGLGTVLLVIAILTAIGLVVFGRRIAEGCPERYLALGFVISGIIGNSYDRLFRTPSAVVDFLDFCIVYGGSFYHWPAFNVADSCICIGAFLLLISNFLRKDIKKIKNN